MNVLANDLQLHRFGNSFALDLYHDRRTRHTAKVVTYLTYGQSLGGLAVDGENTVAGLHACPLCWFALVGVHSIGPKTVFGLLLSRSVGTRTLLNNTTDTAVLAGGHHAQLAVVLLGIIDGVGVYLMEHGVDGRLRQILVVKGVHVVNVHLTQHVIEDADAFLRPRRLLPLLSYYCQRQ